MLRYFKVYLENIRYIVNAPVVNLMLLIGFLCFVLSFLKLDGLKAFSLTRTPNNLIMCIIGIILLLGSPVIFRFTRENRKINKKVTIEKGLSFSFNKLTVKLMMGEIQEISSLSKDSAVVLPVNTTFIDDCFNDDKSACGAYFLKFYRGKIPKIVKDIEKELKKQNLQKDENNSYPPGTTIILPSEYDTPAKCIITASTIRKERIGIRASPSTICECIRQIFEITADKKIEKLHVPVLGSGHGGMDINDALLFLLLALKYYSNHYHHIKLVNIMVTPTDVTKLRDIYKLQYLSFLEVRGK